MFNLFNFLHLVATMVWIGGVFALVVINARLAGANNRAAMEALGLQAAFYGRAVLGPAAGLTLLAGIVSTILMGVSFTALWILWGLAGVFGSMILGAVFIRRANEEIGREAAAPSPDNGRIAELRRRLVTLNVINLLLLLSTVAAMVFKPVL